MTLARRAYKRPILERRGLVICIQMMKSNYWYSIRTYVSPEHIVGSDFVGGHQLRKMLKDGSETIIILIENLLLTSTSSS